MVRKHKCKVIGCDYYESHGLKFWPTEPEIIQQWLNALQLDSFKPSWRICMAHFTDNDFEMLENGSRRLRSNAVPSVNVRVSIALTMGYFLIFVHIFMC